MTNAIESICVLRLSALGDVCNAVAAVQAIQKQYSQARISWIIGKLEHQLVQHLPGIEFIVFDKKQGRQAIRELKRKLQGRRFDVLLHMQVALRANRLAHLVPAARKIGYDWARAKEGHSLVINEHIEKLDNASQRYHVLDSFLSFAKKIGVQEEQCYPPTWNIPVSDEDEAEANRMIAPDTTFFVICPAASKAERCASIDIYADAANYAHRKGMTIVLCGGPADLDKTLATEITQQSKVEVLNLVGKTSLGQLYAILGRASLVLAPDTGPAHMANAQGVPVVGLYAHSNPRRTGPYNSIHLTVNAYDYHLEQQTGRQYEQFKWGERVKGDHLMDVISVEDVRDKIDQALLEAGQG